MAQGGCHYLDPKTLSCSICLDLLKVPVTIPCGHSFCMDCIDTDWQKEDENNPLYSCPQCRNTLYRRPNLVKNTILAELVEEVKEEVEKKEVERGKFDDLSYARGGDVACDVCKRKKLKAVKSCLVCMVSYCEKHLQPHFKSTAFENHKLVKPSKSLLEDWMCGRHEGEVLKMFCRTDQKLICFLCAMEGHRGHETVAAAMEVNERQTELEMSRRTIQQRIQDRERYVNVLLSEKAAINKLQETLELEITKLKKKDDQLTQLLDTEDQNLFLKNFYSLSQLDECANFEDLTAIVRREDLVLTHTSTNTSITDPQIGVLVVESEPKTRDDFLKYSCPLTLDPNTAHTLLMLTDANRKATIMQESQSYYSTHTDRFTFWRQVLSKESLSERSYFEVKWRGKGVEIAVACRNIPREGSESGFGENDKSWVLSCDTDSFDFWFNNVQSDVIVSPWAQSFRIGVYVDRRAGVLSFYKVEEEEEEAAGRERERERRRRRITMTLLHSVQTTFTQQPLHAGFGFFLYSNEAYAQFSQLQ